jgi:hypothetical protein
MGTSMTMTLNRGDYLEWGSIQNVVSAVQRISLLGVAHVLETKGNISSSKNPILTAIN